MRSIKSIGGIVFFAALVICVSIGLLPAEKAEAGSKWICDIHVDDRDESNHGIDVETIKDAFTLEVLSGEDQEGLEWDMSETWGLDGRPYVSISIDENGDSQNHVGGITPGTFRLGFTLHPVRTDMNDFGAPDSLKPIVVKYNFSYKGKVFEDTATLRHRGLLDYEYTKDYDLPGTDTAEAATDTEATTDTEAATDAEAQDAAAYSTENGNENRIGVPQGSNVKIEKVNALTDQSVLNALENLLNSIKNATNNGILAVFNFEISASGSGQIIVNVGTAYAGKIAIVGHYTGGTWTVQQCKVQQNGYIYPKFASFSPISVIVTNQESAISAIPTTEKQVSEQSPATNDDNNAVPTLLIFIAACGMFISTRKSKL